MSLCSHADGIIAYVAIFLFLALGIVRHDACRVPPGVGSEVGADFVLLFLISSLALVGVQVFDSIGTLI